MIKTMVIIALFALPLVACSQTKSVAELQTKYKDDGVFTLKFNDALQIIAVSSDAKNYSANDIKRLKKEISEDNYEEVMAIKNGKGELKVHMKENKGKKSKVIMIADSESEGFIALDFTGKLED